MDSDTALMVVHDSASGHKTVKCLADACCDLATSHGITELQIVDHDLSQIVEDCVCAKSIDMNTVNSFSHVLNRVDKAGRASAGLSVYSERQDQSERFHSEECGEPWLGCSKHCDWRLPEG